MILICDLQSTWKSITFFPQDKNIRFYDFSLVIVIDFWLYFSSHFAVTLVYISIKRYVWQETLRKLWTFKGLLNSAHWMGEHTELRRNISKNDNKIMQKFNDKTLAWYRYKQKKNLWATFQTTVHSTQSPNLVSKLIAAISLKLVFVKLPAFPVKLLTCVWNSQNSYFWLRLLYPCP